MVNTVLKTINKFRRIYHRKRYGKRFFEQPVVHTSKVPYIDHPRVSAVLQLFNKRQNIEAIVGALLNAPIEEIIVIDDGSRDGALEILPKLLTGKNHFIIRANDIFEIRTYSRALDFTRAEIVALLQDDDIPPINGSWIEDALALFDRYPKLAVLGGRDGLELKVTANGNGPSLAYDLVNHRNGDRVKLPFTFVDTVNRAPILLRRETIQRLGGIDNAFAPYQCDDVDLCLRAWKAGLQVGLYSTEFVRDVGMGGMRIFNADELPEQAKKNWKIIYERYGNDVGNGFFASVVANARNSECV
jgi:glycosyltransferase involved in cell wall biosynthesis